MTEILLGIRVVKFNVWEGFLTEKVDRYYNRILGFSDVSAILVCLPISLFSWPTQ